MNTENEKTPEPNPKTFSNFDKLNLEGFANTLLENITKNSPSSTNKGEAYTISLNAGFGNGKTTFLEMFSHFIEKKENYNVLYINAWQSDFYDDPLITILSEFMGFFYKDASLIKEEAAKEVIKECLSQFLASKIGLDLQALKKLCNEKESLLENFIERSKFIKNIKKSIKNIIPKNKKLIIIVDELDRTQPNYAIKFLEHFKHFFDIEGIVFLFAVNREQIKATAKCIYGSELDFDGYYRKFFKQEVSLPYPHRESRKFIDDLLKEKFKNNDFFIKKHIHLSCKILGLTLRDVENFTRIFRAMLKNNNFDFYNEPTHHPYIIAFSFFICFSMKEEELFKKILDETFLLDDFIKWINSKNICFNGVRITNEVNKEGEITFRNVPDKFANAVNRENKKIEEAIDISRLLTITASSFNNYSNHKKNNMIIKKAIPLPPIIWEKESTYLTNITESQHPYISHAHLICGKIQKLESLAE